MPSTDSTVARRIFGRCASKTQHGGYALWCPALNTAEVDRLRDQKFESGSLQRGVACEPEDDIDIPVRRGSTITIRSRSTTSRRDSRVAERLSRMPYRPRAGGFSGP